MTYEQALEAWARKQFPDIPEDATRFELGVLWESQCLALDLQPSFFMKILTHSDFDRVVREITETALEGK